MNGLGFQMMFIHKSIKLYKSIFHHVIYQQTGIEAIQEIKTKLN
jgi:hypothetical protein